ncbi:glycosyltransferase [Vibrio sinaloensis]|nr:glycosyltransferase [Vibrio sinaloensis]
MRDRLETHADCLHLNEHVHFIGEQDNVIGWLKGCDAFISGARSEAFGLVIAEAALAKKFQSLLRKKVAFQSS